MSVGAETIDRDHKILVQCLNDFIEATENDEGVFVTDSILTILLDYTNFHFSKEEKIMEACEYPGLEEHKAEHEALKAKVLECRDKIVLDINGKASEEIKTFLMVWLSEHILTSDMAYKKYIEGKDTIITQISDADA